jgi:hypothetical protein
VLKAMYTHNFGQGYRYPAATPPKVQAIRKYVYHQNFSTMKKVCFFIIAIYVTCTSSKCSKENKDDPYSASCVDAENLSRDTTCFSATVLTQGVPYFNPVNRGDNVFLKMKIAAIGLLHY